MILKNAVISEANDAYKCIEDARIYHKSLGFLQWHDGYPTLNTILDDIENNTAFVFYDNNMVVGYCSINLNEEIAYRNIDGNWKTNNPYAVVHRMAFSNSIQGKGLSNKAFTLIKEYCKNNNIKSIRVDTQEENKVVQHILNREGFEYCGIITFDGGPKLAFECIII